MTSKRSESHHELHSSSAHKTANHDEIRRWVEARGGVPSTVKGTSKDGAGVLRIDFPESEADERLEAISWEEFFDKFDESELEFLYQDEKASGERSYFCKFVGRSEGAPKIH